MRLSPRYRFPTSTSQGEGSLAHGGETLAADPHLRQFEFLRSELTALVLVQSVELRLHELHPFLLGYLAVLVRIHQE